MIICQCNVIKRADIVAAIRGLLADDPSAPLEPQYIYLALQRRGRCCGCFPMVRTIVNEMLEDALLDVTGVSVLKAACEEKLMPKDVS